MKAITVGCAAWLLLCAVVPRAEAQSAASSFDQLTVLVKPGDKVSVVDVTGREAVGRIGTLSRDAMTLVTEAGPRVLAEADVAQIRQRRGDSLKNGALIGAGAGTAYFLIGAALLADSDGGDVIVGSAIVGGVVCAGLGAPVGAGIDALIARRRVIYERPAGGKTVGVAPILDRRRRGAVVSVTF